MPFFARRLPAFVLAALPLLPVPAALADEAYVCEGGGVVYVPLGQLESMKRTNACIAAYYGLTVDAAAATAASVPDSSAKPAPASGTPRSGPALKPTLEGGDDQAALGKSIPVQSVSKVAVRAEPPKPAPNTDFRNVHVINATGEDKSFFHAR